MKSLPRIHLRDWTIVLFWLPIPLFGLSLLLSTAPELFVAQVANFFVGFLALILILQIDFSQIKKLYWLFYFLTIVTILTVYVFGDPIRGSYRWIDLGFTKIQPSEVAKPFFLLFFAQFFSVVSMKKLKNILFALMLFAIPFLLVFKEPDLGSSLVYASVFVALLFKSNIRMKYIAFLLIGFIAILPVAWNAMHDYQRDRVLAFLNPDRDPLGKTYNITQAMIALGSGQVMGRGLGHGTQTQLKFLPEHTTDFIYASLGEELGFVGSLAVVAFFLLLFWRLAVQSEQESDQFRANMLFGIGILFLSQAFIHIGGNIAMLPLTGITLPFMSYGGSSVVASMVLFGIAIRLLMDKKPQG